jgi:hypothetical protein
MGIPSIQDKFETGESKLGLACRLITQEKMNDKCRVFPGMIEDK